MISETNISLEEETSQQRTQSILYFNDFSTGRLSTNRKEVKDKREKDRLNKQKKINDIKSENDE